MENKIIDKTDTTTSRHGLVARILHWTTPLLLLYAYIRNGDVTGALNDSAAMNREIQFGIAVFAIFATRYFWMHMFNGGASRVSPQAPRLERWLSTLGHNGLYADVAAIISTGLMIPVVQAQGNAFALQGIVDVHVFFADVMLFLMGGHVLAALWHKIFRNDGIWESIGAPRLGMRITNLALFAATFVVWLIWRTLRRIWRLATFPIRAVFYWMPRRRAL